jgi:DnaA family protein
VSKQLALGLSPPPQPTLDNFVAGSNAELLARLRALVAGTLGERVVYLWGEAGSGRSHLLRACARPGLHTVDDVGQLGETEQIQLFNHINEGMPVLAAGDAPPSQLQLRPDVRTRLASGLVYQVRPLTDDERALYLRAEAERRGMRLDDEVISYLLTRARRDVPTLTAVLDGLDRVSLEKKRHITVPLAREILEK